MDENDDAFMAALALKDEIKRIAGTSKSIWGRLQSAVERKYVYAPDIFRKLSSGCVLLLWTGNNEAYARGLARNSSPDISFYSRVVKNLETKVPMALVEEKGMAKALEGVLVRIKNPK